MFCILVVKIEQEALKAELIIQNWKVGLDKDLKTNINVITDYLERVWEDSLEGTWLFKSIPNETLCMALTLAVDTVFLRGANAIFLNKNPRLLSESTVKQFLWIKNK